MKSEAKANQDMQARADTLEWGRKEWAKVLSVKPAKVAERKPVKSKGFFSMFFKG